MARIEVVRSLERDGLAEIDAFLDRLTLTTGHPALGEQQVLNLRRPLPVAEGWSIAVRPFRPGADEDAWLRVNKRAFAGHPEQSAWTREMLEVRERLPWFDAGGFLLHEDDGRLAGFCWTKV